MAKSLGQSSVSCLGAEDCRHADTGRRSEVSLHDLFGVGTCDMLSIIEVE